MTVRRFASGDEGSALASAAALTGLVLVLAVDAVTGPGSAAALLYVPLVLAASLTGRPRLVVSVTAAALVLTVAVGVFSLPPAGTSGYSTGYVVWNRLVTLLGIGACGWLGVVMLRARRHLESVNRSLVSARRRESDQHDLVAVAGESGQFRGWSVDIVDGEMAWSDELAPADGGQPGHSPSIAEAISFYLPEDQARISVQLDRCVREGVPFDEELRLAQPDGDRVWVNAVGAAELGPEGAVVRVYGTFRDITRRRAAELSAADSLRRLRLMADAMPLLVWTARGNGEIDSFSRGLSEYTGATPSEILGASWLALIHPEDRRGCIERWSRSVDTQEPYLMEFRIRRHDGAFRWHLTQASPELDPDGRVITWWGSSTDIDDLRRTQEESRALATRLSETLDSIGDAVLALDPEWRVTFMNRNAERLLHRDLAGLVGKVVWEEFPEAEGMMFRPEYDRAIAEDRPVRFEAEYPPVGLWLEISAYPHAEGLTIYFRDITEQRSLAEQLAHAQRLKSLGQLTGGVAHDFNNLLTVIMGSSEVLVAELADQPTQRFLAETILGVAERGGELTHSLLAFAGNQPLSPSSTDLNTLVEDTRPMLSRTLGDSIEVVCRLDPNLHRCVVDRGQLENALLNLCLNARDAMPSGGRLTVETANVVLDSQYAAGHADVEAGDYVLLVVSDQGEGISPGDLTRIFEPFFTTKAVGKGSGLGLAMVYGFVHQSLGHVRVSSERGHGTTMRIYLPVAAAGAPDADPVVARTGTVGHEHVLVVEDDDLIRSTVREQLTSLGYHVTDAADGPAALQLLAGGLGVDLLLTDFVMPGGMTGGQLALRARASLPGLPVLYTSGYPRGGVSDDGPGDPEVRLLSKPYGLAELALNVREAIDAPPHHREAS